MTITLFCFILWLCLITSWLYMICFLWVFFFSIYSISIAFELSCFLFAAATLHILNQNALIIINVIRKNILATVQLVLVTHSAACFVCLSYLTQFTSWIRCVKRERVDRKATGLRGHTLKNKGSKRVFLQWCHRRTILGSLKNLSVNSS